MPHRRHDDDNDPADRWLVSYADFITLLFAFFVVMYAISLQGGQYQAFSNSVDQALGVDGAQAKAGPAPGKDPAAPSTPEPDDMQLMAEQLARRMSVLFQQGAAQVRRTPLGIEVELDAGILFAPAEASVNATALQALRSVADVLRTHAGNTIQVVGHTDDIDIHSAHYPSNWELSAARASSVVRLFIEAGIDSRRLAAIGRGATQPVASNANAEGRLRNRRVEIRILSNGPQEKAGDSATNAKLR